MTSCTSSSATARSRSIRSAVPTSGPYHVRKMTSNADVSPRRRRSSSSVSLAWLEDNRETGDGKLETTKTTGRGTRISEGSYFPDSKSVQAVRHKAPVDQCTFDNPPIPDSLLRRGSVAIECIRVAATPPYLRRSELNAQRD